MKKMIYTEQAPKPIGIYSQAIQHGNTVYLAGQIPVDPLTQLVVQGSFTDQIKQVFKNIEAIVQAAGGCMNDIVKVTVYMTDLAKFADVNMVMQELFREPYPARTTIEVQALPKQVAIEIECIMILPSS